MKGSRGSAGPADVPGDVASRALFVRHRRVMLGNDLAKLFEVEPRELMGAVKRHIARFPADFMFQLTHPEVVALRGQSALPSLGGARSRPYVFTAEGVAMLSSVLSSGRAVQVSVALMRSLVKLRQMAASDRDLARKLEEQEKRQDGWVKVVFDALLER